MASLYTDTENQINSSANQKQTTVPLIKCRMLRQTNAMRKRTTITTPAISPAWVLFASAHGLTVSEQLSAIGMREFGEGI